MASVKGSGVGPDYGAGKPAGISKKEAQAFEKAGESLKSSLNKLVQKFSHLIHGHGFVTDAEYSKSVRQAKIRVYEFRFKNEGEKALLADESMADLLKDIKKVQKELSSPKDFQKVIKWINDAEENIEGLQKYNKQLFQEIINEFEKLRGQVQKQVPVKTQPAVGKIKLQQKGAIQETIGRSYKKRVALVSLWPSIENLIKQAESYNFNKRGKYEGEIESFRKKLNTGDIPPHKVYEEVENFIQFIIEKTSSGASTGLLKAIAPIRSRLHDFAPKAEIQKPQAQIPKPQAEAAKPKEVPSKPSITDYSLPLKKEVKGELNKYLREVTDFARHNQRIFTPEQEREIARYKESNWGHLSHYEIQKEVRAAIALVEGAYKDHDWDSYIPSHKDLDKLLKDISKAERESSPAARRFEKEAREREELFGRPTETAVAPEPGRPRYISIVGGDEPITRAEKGIARAFQGRIKGRTLAFQDSTRKIAEKEAEMGEIAAAKKRVFGHLKSLLMDATRRRPYVVEGGQITETEPFDVSQVDSNEKLRNNVNFILRMTDKELETTPSEKLIHYADVLVPMLDKIFKGTATEAEKRDREEIPDSIQAKKRALSVEIQTLESRLRIARTPAGKIQSAKASAAKQPAVEVAKPKVEAAKPKRELGAKAWKSAVIQNQKKVVFDTMKASITDAFRVRDEFQLGKHLTIDQQDLLDQYGSDEFTFEDFSRKTTKEVADVVDAVTTVIRDGFLSSKEKFWDASGKGAHRAPDTVIMNVESLDKAKAKLESLEEHVKAGFPKRAAVSRNPAVQLKQMREDLAKEIQEEITGLHKILTKKEGIEKGWMDNVFFKFNDTLKALRDDSVSTIEALDKADEMFQSAIKFVIKDSEVSYQKASPHIRIHAGTLIKFAAEHEPASKKAFEESRAELEKQKDAIYDQLGDLYQSVQNEGISQSKDVNALILKMPKDSTRDAIKHTHEAIALLEKQFTAAKRKVPGVFGYTKASLLKKLGNIEAALKETETRFAFNEDRMLKRAAAKSAAPAVAEVDTTPRRVTREEIGTNLLDLFEAAESIKLPDGSGSLLTASLGRYKGANSKENQALQAILTRLKAAKKQNYQVNLGELRKDAKEAVRLIEKAFKQGYKPVTIASFRSTDENEVAPVSDLSENEDYAAVAAMIDIVNLCIEKTRRRKK